VPLAVLISTGAGMAEPRALAAPTQAAPCGGDAPALPTELGEPRAVDSGAGGGLYVVEVETALGGTTRQQIHRPGSGAAVRVERSPSGAVRRVAHGFAYTPVDLPSLYQPPALPGGGSATTYAYDLDRALGTVLRPDGQAIALDYDGAGRLASIETPQGAITLSRVSGTDKVASLTTSGGSTIAYAYDGFLPTGTTWTGPVAGSVARTYDADFRIAGRSVNGGAPTTFAYDGDGLLVRAGSLVLGRDAATGLVTGTSLGQLATQQSYNAFGELASWTASMAGAPLMSVQLGRDALGRIAAKTETIAGETTAFAYSYDLAGRLTDASRNGALVGHYEYDANGNRLAYQGTFGPAQASYDNQDRLLSYGDLTFTYTAAGELQTKSQGGQTVTYAYDPLGSLRSVQMPDDLAIEYVLDGANRRIGKRVNGTLVQGFLYQDLLKPIAELDGLGSIVSLFVYGSRPNVPEYLVKAGTTYRIVADHLGSPRLVIDVGTGTVAQRLDYDEFGRVILDTNAGFQPFGFAGGLYDPQTGLVRFGARDYDPEVGRWTTRDPILFRGGSLNLYAYALNDPVNRVDSDGLSAGVLAPAWGTALAEPSPLGEGIALGITLWVGIDWLWHRLADDAAHEPIPAPDAVEPDVYEPGEACPAVPRIPFPGWDPTVPPREGMEWKGKPPQGGPEGAWVDPKTGESFHPDLGHPPPAGPHWDYNDGLGGHWRVDPSGNVTPRG
jgi:RHS repeat-associated protein